MAIENANVAFRYAANGFRDKSKDRYISIYKRDTPALIKQKRRILMNWTPIMD